MKIVFPVNRPIIKAFKDIPEGTIFQAGSGSMYRKLANHMLYDLDRLTVCTIGDEIVYFGYIPYPNATLILEPDQEAKRG